MNHHNACSCTLDPAALTARLDAWQRVTARAISRTVDDDGVVGTYPNDPALLSELRDLIAAEAECCSFLRFSIEEKSNLLVTKLEFPPSMREMILDVVGPQPDGASVP